LGTRLRCRRTDRLHRDLYCRSRPHSRHRRPTDRQGGRCVDARDGQTADGTPLVVVQCHGSPNERWFIKGGVISESFGSCIDVLGSAPIDGTAIVLINCTGTFSQQWSIRDGQIVGLGDKCLTETGGISADQTPLILVTCNANPGQLWTIR
jgi:alpha-N-acetylglucosaminidase